MNTRLIVSMIETREQTQERTIYYNLQVPLPENFNLLTLDEQSFWINENAEFVKDNFDEPVNGDIEEEITTKIEGL